MSSVPCLSMKNYLKVLVHLEVCYEDEWQSRHADSIMASVMKHICSVVKLSLQQLFRTLKRRDIFVTRHYMSRVAHQQF